MTAPSMNRLVGRARRSETRRQAPARTRNSSNGLISSDAESLSGPNGDVRSAWRANSIVSSSSGDDDDEDETLRRAFEESLRLDNERRQRREEADREARDREEEVRLRSLRDAEEEARMEQEATRQEEEALRVAVEASQAEERARAMREREERRSIRRAESRFGTGQQRDLGSQGTTSDPSLEVRPFFSGPQQLRATEARPDAEADRLSLERHRPRRVRDAVRTAVQRSRAFSFSHTPELGEPASQRANTDSRPVGTSATNVVSTRPIVPPVRVLTTEQTQGMAARRHRVANSLPGNSVGSHIVNPAAYSLEEMISRSRHQAYPEGPFTEEGQEFNHDELQRAINESAEQHRDEEEEAVERSRGIPTYEEACSSRRYRPPPGMRYSFQGPEVIEIESEGKPPMKLKIIGDMDLGEAMKIANQRNKRKRDQTELN